MAACPDVESASPAPTASVPEDGLRHLLLSAALSMSQHPQDHGWREIYKQIAQTLSNNAQSLMDPVKSIPDVQSLAPAYVIGLVGISLQQLWQNHGHGRDPTHRQLPGAEIVNLATDRRVELSSILARHRNSFTGVRRFLVPQLLLATHFRLSSEEPISFLDIGTGIGVLPRQLDSPKCFRRFAADLTWPEGARDFSEIGIGARFGMELSPIPDLGWVHGCYGPSEYYDLMFQEMRDTLAMADVQAANVTFVDQDARDLVALSEFIADENIAAVTAVYSLYQYSPRVRQDIANTIHRCLPPGGIFIDIEPHPALDRPGCVVEAWIQGVDDKLTICVVSDGHFRGLVIAAKDYDRFARCRLR